MSSKKRQIIVYGERNNTSEALRRMVEDFFYTSKRDYIASVGETPRVKLRVTIEVCKEAT